MAAEGACVGFVAKDSPLYADLPCDDCVDTSVRTHCHLCGGTDRESVQYLRGDHLVNLHWLCLIVWDAVVGLVTRPEHVTKLSVSLGVNPAQLESRVCALQERLLSRFQIIFRVSRIAPTDGKIHRIGYFTRVGKSKFAGKR